MPFPQQEPSPFSQTGVERFATNQTGHYGLFRGNVCVYVGTGNIRDRLLEHIGGDNPCITREHPTYYMTAVGPHPEGKENLLILELAPVCNRRIG